MTGGRGCIVSKRRCENSKWRFLVWKFVCIWNVYLGDVLFLKSCWYSKICENIVLENLKK